MQVEVRGQEGHHRRGDQVAANSGDSWEEGHGEVRVEKRLEGASEQSQAGLWVFRALLSAAPYV